MKKWDGIGEFLAQRNLSIGINFENLNGLAFDLSTYYENRCVYDSSSQEAW
jgi:hypothetical protein